MQLPLLVETGDPPTRCEDPILRSDLLLFPWEPAAHDQQCAGHRTAVCFGPRLSETSLLQVLRIRGGRSYHRAAGREEGCLRPRNGSCSRCRMSSTSKGMSAPLQKLSLRSTSGCSSMLRTQLVHMVCVLQCLFMLSAACPL